MGKTSLKRLFSLGAILLLHACDSPTDTVPLYTLSTTTNEFGSVSPEQIQLSPGASAIFYLTPNTGYEVASTNGCEGQVEDNQFISEPIHADCTLQVEFAVTTFNIQLNISKGGSISPSEDLNFDYSSDQLFTVLPDEGYEIESVIGCDGELQNREYQLRNIQSDCEITAIFRLVAQQPQPGVLFEDNFDSVGGLNRTTPWKWEQPFSADNRYGMMFGENDIYNIIEFEQARSGGKVLRLAFENRNNWCNSCGARAHTVTEAELAESCLQLAGGVWGPHIYNRSGGWSRWQITSSDSATVCFNQQTPDALSMFDRNTIIAGDDLRVSYQCGVNGVIGGEPGRRVDCNLGINYLENIQPEDFAYGETLSRRKYFMLDEQVDFVNVGLKLAYVNFRNESGPPNSIIAVIAVRSSGLFLEVDAYFGYQFTGLSIEKGKWYYLEEMFTRETGLNVGDGRYQLFAGEENSTDLDVALLDEDQLNLGPLIHFSIIGNWPHTEDARGNFYLDDVMIKKGKIGPTTE
ncbi:MAG: hypothetical protein OEZ58_14955 [Gammaproteobacteria bacterium]|nr:hypothetical protein [Gammaproteobacteria bacterium]